MPLPFNKKQFVTVKARLTKWHLKKEVLLKRKQQLRKRSTIVVFSEEKKKPEPQDIRNIDR